MGGTKRDMLAGRGGTGGIEEPGVGFRRAGAGFGGVVGWLKLTLSDSPAVEVYAGGGGTQLSASLS